MLIGKWTKINPSIGRYCNYFSLDDAATLSFAESDPAGFVAALPDPMILDEVQRVPELMRAIKLSVDSDRRPGRFLLTGSANLLLLPRLGDSLAGRMEVVALQPLTAAEQMRRPGRFLSDLLASRLRSAIEPAHLADLSPLAERAVTGGFPEAVRRTTSRARTWHRQYLRRLIERDVQDIARVREPHELSRLLHLLALRSAQLLNVSSLAKELALRRETVEHYLAVCERLFLLRRLQPWHRNHAKRLIRTPKLHLVDSGLAATLAGLTAGDPITRREQFGHLLETFVVQQLISQAGWSAPELDFWHYRNKDQVEVDLVITRGREVRGVEVKAAATVTSADGHGLRRLAAQAVAIVGVTGPRQSGKTTLARAIFAGKPYVSLEDPDVRELATDDPRAFLSRYREGAVLDEAQRAPALFSYLQSRVDETGSPGQFVLTGSQQFGMVSAITQSLAGRVALLALLPFSLSELHAAGRVPESVDELLWRGGYPPIHDRPVDPATWYGSYVQTYLERDIRQLIQIRDLTQFQRFLRLCAGRTGQLLNQSALGEEAGVSHNTVREWISVLEASYIIHRLPPQHRNFNKRLVKTPKLYFVDVGLAAWLLGIETPGHMATHPLRGPLFETWVVSEYLKGRFNRGLVSNLTFWRDRRGREINLLLERGGRLQPVEIKAGATLGGDAFRGLEQWRELVGDAAIEPRLVYAGDDPQERRGIAVHPWRDLAHAVNETP